MRILKFPWIYFLIVFGFGAVFFWLRLDIRELSELQGTFEEYSLEWSRIEQQLDDLLIHSLVCLLGALFTVIALIVHTLIKILKGRTNALP